MSSQTVGLAVALGIFFVLLALLVASKWKWLVVAAAGLVIALIAGLSDMIGLGNHPGYGFLQIGGMVVGGLIFIVSLIAFLRTRRRLS